MPGRMFDDSGRLNIPDADRNGRGEHIGPPVVVNAVYCPAGHDLVSLDHEVSGFPAIVLRFSGRRSGEGVLALSAVHGDTAHAIVSGSVRHGEPLDLSCPHCGVALDVLGDCPCTEGAVTHMAYLYPRKDPHQAIAFCNVLDCPNSAVIRSGEVIRRHSERPWIE